MILNLLNHEKLVSQEFFGNYTEIVTLAYTRGKFKVRSHRFSQDDEILSNTVSTFSKYELKSLLDFGKDSKVERTLSYSKNLKVKFFQTKFTITSTTIFSGTLETLLVNKASLINLEKYLKETSSELYKTIEESSFEVTKQANLNSEKVYKKALENQKGLTATKDIDDKIKKLKEDNEIFRKNSTISKYLVDRDLIRDFTKNEVELKTLELEKEVLFKNNKEK